MPSLRSQLIGSWELISVTAHKEDNPSDVRYPMGQSPRGIIMYSPDGYMSCQQQEPGASLYSGSKDFNDGTEEEYAATAKRYLAYSGPFYVDEREGASPRLWHGMTVSLVPNWINNVQGRIVEIEEQGQDKILHLEPSKPTLSGGDIRIVHLKWRRMKDNSASGPPPE